jgi:hypothetical protein
MISCWRLKLYRKRKRPSRRIVRVVVLSAAGRVNDSSRKKGKALQGMAFAQDLRWWVIQTLQEATELAILGGHCIVHGI